MPLVEALAALDMEPAVRSGSLVTAGADPGQPVRTSDDYSIPRRKWMLLAVAGVAAVSAEVFAWIGNQEHAWLVIALALIAILTGGTGTLRKGWIALRNRFLNMNFLMSIAVIGAAAIGEWPEAAIVIVLFALAELIEALSLDRARNAIKGLMAMSPERATVQAADGRWVRKSPPRTRPWARSRASIRASGFLWTASSSMAGPPSTGSSNATWEMQRPPPCRGRI